MAHQSVDPTTTTDSNLEGTSPRSTILVGASPVSAHNRNNNNSSNMTEESTGASSPEKGGGGGNNPVPPGENKGGEEPTASGSNNTEANNKDTAGATETVTTDPQTGHNNNETVVVQDTTTTTTPLSPQPHHPVAATGPGAFYGYAAPTQAGGASFLLPHHQSPLSPPRAMATPTTSTGSAGPPPPPGTAIPPASPLFPRLNSGNQAAVLAATGEFAATYPTYSTTTAMGSPSATDSNWNTAEAAGRNNGQPPPPSASPQVQGMPYGSIAGAAVATSSSNNNKGRAYSFEDTMLTPAAVTATTQSDGSQDGSNLGTANNNPAYSPYSTASAGSTLFATGQFPPYTNAVPDIYNATPPSPLQPRPMAPHHHHHHHPMHHHPQGPGAGGPPPQHHMGYPPPPMNMRGQASPGGYYGAPPPPHHHHPHHPHAGGFPSSSPGPPIQTTASNKGPEGANLFIFHIPNSFTNLDMYQLFEPYGNLLSVRIMVEKETGRSRGFGFVSYDSPESAALAIKALNGFAIGNKRLKVQHKQIRPKDMMHDREQQQQQAHGYGQAPGMPHDFGGPSSSWGPTPTNVAGKPPPPPPQDENTELTSQSTGAETPSFGATSAATGNDHPLSPLASLGSLQNALPDVGGGPGSAPGSGNHPAAVAPGGGGAANDNE